MERQAIIVAAQVVAKKSQKKLMALCSLLSTQMLHHRDLTNKLKNSKIDNKFRAEFSLLPRPYLAKHHEVKSDVKVEIEQWTFPYGFEYQGAYSRLGLTSGGDYALFKLAYGIR